MKHDDTRYQPIPCGEYSRYEVLIIHNERLRICWREPDDQLHLMRLRPYDLQTRDNAEFMLARDHKGKQYRIRLDYIRHYDVI